MEQGFIPSAIFIIDKTTIENAIISALTVALLVFIPLYRRCGHAIYIGVVNGYCF